MIDIVSAIEGVVHKKEASQAIINNIHSRWQPRSIESAYKYLRSKIYDLKSDFYFYGAGSHTQQLFRLDNDNFLRNRVSGIIDKRAKNLDSSFSFNLPLFSLSDLPYLEKQPIVLSHHELELSLKSELYKRSIKDDRVIGIYSDPGYMKFVNDSLFNESLDNIKWDKRGCRILLISARPTTIVSLKAWKKLQCSHSFIHINIGRDDNFNQQFSHKTLNCEQSIQRLLQCTEHLKPDIVYIYDQFTTGNTLAILVKSLFPQIKVILELYDFINLFFSDPDIMSKEWYWNREELDAALAGESEGMYIYDGLVHKEDNSVVKEIIPIDNKKILSFKPFIEKNSIINYSQDKNQTPARLVWAGSIIQTSASLQLFGDNQILNIISDLCETGVEISLFTGHKSNIEFSAALPDYSALEKKRSNLTFREALSRIELIKTISREFDYALLLAGKTSKNREFGMKVGFASKVITYIAAGLPIIISDKFEYTANWIKSYNIGIVVRENEIHNLPEIIEKTDYKKLKNSILNMQSTITLEDNIEKLERFISEIASL